MNRKKLYDITLVALFSAIIVICSLISVPSAIPFTLQTFAVFLSLCVLGAEKGILSIVIYIILGLVGLPVFSGFNSGLGALLNVTGGYISGFVFSGYEFADGDGVGTGCIVTVPAEITYREALQNTTIFTSTVMFDTTKLPKEMLQMPRIKSEDTALWWRILRSGEKAYGLQENLVYYRRAGSSLSSNKLEAIRRIWNLYRKEEKLSIPFSIYNFCFWAWRAVKRRV